MISVSDNTAADALVDVLGQAALRHYGGLNYPFLTPREVFILRSGKADGLRRSYLAAHTVREKVAVLRRVDALPLPSLDQLQLIPDHTIEWHYSVRQLCGLMRNVARLPLMTINPGVVSRESFRQVAYKGGSEPGVINLTTMVTTLRGTTLCLSATINDTHPIDETRVEAAYAAALMATATL
jgi:hypothetical protein